jgi:glycosyltransferase involved in cell wall biosynthesis
MKKIGVCGHFAFGESPRGGQTIKTRIISEELQKKYGENEIDFLDTNKWKSNKVDLLINCLKLAYRSKHIIILPAHNGIKVFIPLFYYLTKIFGAKLHYIVVGAWLADEIKNNRFLLNKLKKVNYVYVQTETLEKKLNYLGVYENIYIMKNFKPLKPISDKKINYMNSNSFKVCILSRINEKKGIESAINVINKINERFETKKIVLDIYGPIEDNYKKKFDEILSSNVGTVLYNGSVDYDKTIEVLKDYYLFLFPTKYYTEGFPGTIIDAYSAGLPVLASEWESSKDIIKENYTGVTYEFDNENDFYEKLINLVENTTHVENMMVNCVEEAKKYTPSNALSNLYNNLE